MKKILLRNLPGYAEFRTVCSFEKCEDEYPGWTGKEKYIVFSVLSRSELEQKFPEITEYMSPYILIDAAISTALVEYKRNEDKYRWRAVNCETGFGIEEGTETHHQSLVDNRMEENLTYKLVLEQALDCLTDAQRRRVQMYYLEGYLYSQIASIENTSIWAIAKSIHTALEKMKKFLKEG